ncbi:MAG: acylneuraminate cytidylyltransferase family protein [Desulfobulbaceae bacterium]|nr:acylneuraminate cytidylyltransferase family protein [Desulfobulbaceae bacterium]
MDYVALVCARGGSKGLPGKNIRDLGGRPLLGWSIKTALEVDRISRVIVSTDSEEIAQVAIAQGAEVPFMRPAELARDDSPEWAVWQHALRYLKSEHPNGIAGLVSLPATAPLRNAADVEACLDEFEKGAVDVVITVTDAHRSPYFNMVTPDAAGYSQLVCPPQEKIFRRQDVPVVYDMTTVAYVVRPQFAMECDSLFQGRVRSVHVPLERAVDIDTEFDFKIANCLLDLRKDG